MQTLVFVNLCWALVIKKDDDNDDDRAACAII